MEELQKKDSEEKKMTIRGSEMQVPTEAKLEAEAQGSGDKRTRDVSQGAEVTRHHQCCCADIQAPAANSEFFQKEIYGC